MYRRILVPTDGSAGAEAAVDHAIALADRLDAAVHILYVVDTSALPLDPHAKHVFDHLAEVGRVAVADAVDRARRLDLDPVVGEVREGTPHEVILEYVDEEGIELVVMGTHGRRGVDRYLLGSVTERVVRLADVPVLTIRAATEAA